MIDTQMELAIMEAVVLLECNRIGCHEYTRKIIFWMQNSVILEISIEDILQGQRLTIHIIHHKIHYGDTIRQRVQHMNDDAIVGVSINNLKEWPNQLMILCREVWNLVESVLNGVTVLPELLKSTVHLLMSQNFKRQVLENELEICTDELTYLSRAIGGQLNKQKKLRDELQEQLNKGYDALYKVNDVLHSLGSRYSLFGCNSCILAAIVLMTLCILIVL